MREEIGMSDRFQATIASLPRVELMTRPTPIQRLLRIEEAMGDALRGIRLFAKRDDVMGLGGGGNKLRKLEFLMGDALSKGADTVITVGGRQSNHARLTAAAAARLGLRCELVLTQLVPRLDEDYQYNGNILLDDLFGAHVHDLPGTANALDQANERAALLRAEGRRVYVTPAGGSSPVGCLGYAVCAHEILAQSQAMGVAFDRILVPNGSSGTHAGLAAGLVAMGVSPSLVRSFAVLATEEDTRATTIEKTRETLQGLGQELSFDDAEIDVAGSERGTGYGMPTPSMLAALDLMASREGLLLDPVYSGKAFAGLLAAIRNGDYRSGQNILFVMTGGTPGLFAYRDALAGRRI
jgi:L-cysteate sulfo-lyase